MWPLTMKQRPPIIFFSIMSVRLDSISRIRVTVFSS